MISYTNNKETISKADKLAYWLEDYSRLLSFEDDFNPNYLKSYHRGDVIKVNLGYNIGNVALISQITTISKQKIYDPQKKSDVLSDLRISDKSLDLINEKIKKLYIK